MINTNNNYCYNVYKTFNCVKMFSLDPKYVYIQLMENKLINTFYVLNYLIYHSIV